MLQHGNTSVRRPAFFTETDIERYQEALRAREQSRLRGKWATEVVPNLTARWCVKGLLPLNGLTMVYGASGSGKTFFVADLACRVSLGTSWRGRKTKEGVVAYFAAENPNSVGDRLVAWQRKHGARCPVRLFTSPINLLDNDKVDEIVDELGRLKAEFGYLAMVVFDTVAQSMVGDENSSQDMGALVAAAHRIREAVAPTNVILVHHCGKDEARGARGHSSLKAAVDTEIEITRDGALRCARVRKSRDGVDGGRFPFALVPYVLGLDEDGDEVTSCVATATEMGDTISRGGGDYAAANSGDLSSGRSRPAGAAERIALDTLGTALADSGRSVTGQRDVPPRAVCVTVEDWRAQFGRYYPGTKGPEEVEAAFRRSVRKLVATRAVRHAGGLFWLPPDAERDLAQRRQSSVTFAPHLTVVH